MKNASSIPTTYEAQFIQLLQRHHKEDDAYLNSTYSTYIKLVRLTDLLTDRNYEALPNSH